MTNRCLRPPRCADAPGPWVSIDGIVATLYAPAPGARRPASTEEGARAAQQRHELTRRARRAERATSTLAGVIGATTRCLRELRRSLARRPPA
ncbi:MAG: hypothetical protein ACON4Z_08595, partial [Planctomycetota bacterium]